MRAWTTVELEILKARYPAEGASSELCSVLERSKQAVRRQALRLGLKRPRIELSFIERIRGRCEIDGDCWIWQGVADNDRPRVRHGTRFITVRRQMLVELGHRVRRNDVAVAKCKTPLCVNPDHVIAVSRARLVTEYSQKMPTSIRREINRASAKSRRKLSDEDVAEIIVSDAPGRELAEQYDVSESTISAYRTGRKTRAVSNMWQQLMR